MSVRPGACFLLVLALGALLAPRAGAEQERGLVLARRAQRLLAEGQADAALELLDQARTEWPDSDELYHLLADAHAAKGEVAAALDEYVKASSGPHAFRAHFNSGALRSRDSESKLEQAGVPLDISGLPEDADPGALLPAIEQALPELEQARDDFLQALRLRPDETARESVAALTSRLDELRRMADELKQRQQQQQDQDDQQDQSQDSKDQDQDKNQDQKDQQDQEGDGQQDQKSPPPDQDQSQEGDQEPQDSTQQPPQAQPARPLSDAERAELLDKLEQLEAQQLALERERRARERAAVEKDW